MKLYVVRNKQGKYFRTIGRNGYGSSWVDDLESAKFYSKLGQAKSRVTFFYKSNPSFGCPDILEFELSVFTIINAQAETDKKIKNSKISEIKKRIKRSEWIIQDYRNKIDLIRGSSRLEEIEKERYRIYIVEEEKKIQNRLAEIRDIK